MGANAVNGVINITTKRAAETQGVYVEASAGTEENASLAARYGGRIADRAYYRVFGKYFDRDATFGVDETRPDDWRVGHAGFRADWDPTAQDTLTLQGDIYRGTIGQLAPSVAVEGREGPQGRLRVRGGGGNVLARWRRTLSPESELQLRVYYDRTHRNDPMFVDDLDTLDLDLQHRLPAGLRHEVTWGSSYRFTDNRNEGRIIFAVDPPSSRDHLISGFIQDQIRTVEPLRVTIGTKLARNDFSGTEVQPSGRIAWYPSSTTHCGAPSPGPCAFRPVSSETLPSTSRTRPAVWSCGCSAIRRSNRNGCWRSKEDIDGSPCRAFRPPWRPFTNRYRGLASLEFEDPFVDPASGRTVIPIHSENLTSGNARGFEALITHTPFPASRLTVSYSYLDMSLDPEGADLNRGEFLEGATPRHQFGLRSSVDLPARLQIDALYRHLSAIRRLPTSVTGEGVRGYPELNLRLAWLGWRQAEISLIGQNLFHDHHPEFGPPGRGARSSGASTRRSRGDSDPTADLRR